MDVYVSRKGRVRLMDFNPFGGSTLPLLYTWEELLAKSTPARQSTTLSACNPSADGTEVIEDTAAGARDAEAVELRLVTSPQGVRPSLRALSGAPFDLRDGTPGGSLEELFERLSSMDARGGS